MASRLSIGMPVYNGERYLERTLESLLDQSYPDFELVIADNASTDATAEICAAAAARDSRIRYVGSSENRGATWNFNRAFTLTTGEYFKWAAYDDLCEPEFLACCLAALADDPGAVLAYPKARLIDEDGRVVADHDDHLGLEQDRPHERLAALVRALGYANPVYGVVRADALRRTRLLGAYPSADYVLLAELALLGRFVERPERLFLRRVHPAMSRQANPGASAAASWFRPEGRQRHRSEAWRLVFEHLRAIARSPLPADEKLLCTGTFAHVGGRRYAHHLARELRELVSPKALGSSLTAVRRSL